MTPVYYESKIPLPNLQGIAACTERIMFAEFMIFMAFYAVAFVGHSLHAKRDAGAAHRFALFASVLAKAGAAALHEYAVHLLVYSGYVLKGH